MLFCVTSYKIPFFFKFQMILTLALFVSVSISRVTISHCVRNFQVYILVHT